MSEDELRAGVPRQLPVGEQSHAVPKISCDPAKFIDPNLSEKRAGIPSQKPERYTPSTEFAVTLEEAIIQEEVELSDEVDVPVHSEWRDLLHSPLLTTLLVAAMSALVIVLLSECFQFVNAIQAAPMPVRIAAYLCLGGLALCFCIAIGRLVITYRRLATTPKVSLSTVDDVRTRYDIRNDVFNQNESGYIALQHIVHNYLKRIESKEHVDLLKAGGLSDRDIQLLRENLQSLLDAEAIGDEKWLRDYTQLFLSILDNCAKQRVKWYAKRAAVKTAFMPAGVADALIVATNAVYLVEELSRIYLVRTNVKDAALLTARLAFNAFISGRLEDRIDEISDSLFGGAISGASDMAKEVFSKVSLGLLKRTAEGAVNFALMYRLGGIAIIYLRPIRL